jgi:NAD(P)-dependent dehydrogenase (short-subunit alcohol dehydrogenase family)
MDISGNAAVVTGGASGIGLACCHTLLKSGCSVVIADLDEERCGYCVKDE